MDIYQEKAGQATSLLDEFDLDLWLTFVRETAEHTDPVLKLLGPFGVTWPTALLFARSGERIAICGFGDHESLETTGIFDEVLPYKQSIREDLVQSISRLDPQRIGINFSRSDVSADGLTHGMYLNLLSYLADTPYAGRLVSAEDFIASWRGRKSTQELERMRQAISTSMALFDEVAAWVQPGVSEKEINAFMLERVRERGVEPAWDAVHCPSVSAGPDTPFGHAAPTDIRLERGHTLSMDFGVKQEGYCSDHQRTWYVLDEGEEEAPEEVRRAFDAVAGAIRAAADFVRPGVKGWEVDAVARKFITDAGFPEYPHALGHSVGRYAHDGGTGFYPRWERYGDKPYGEIEAGWVYTIELEAMTSRGLVSLEEEILVTEDGCEWLAPPQTELMYIRAGRREDDPSPGEWR